MAQWHALASCTADGTALCASKREPLLVQDRMSCQGKPSSFRLLGARVSGFRGCAVGLTNSRILPRAPLTK
ncbi:hypothetical protein CRG98_000695, partial [Punica granatum]